VARSVSARTLVPVAAALALLTVLSRGSPAALAATSCQLDGVERIVAVGDVHGAYDRFVGILRAAGILDERQRWIGGRTHLVQTGDVLDRGADSRKALDLLERLDGEARRAGGAVHQLLGNHEVMRILGDVRYVSPGEYEAFQTSRSEEIREDFLKTIPADQREQVLKQTPLGFVEMRLAFGREGRYGKSLRRLDAVAVINGVVFLHGGISPSVAPMKCDAINTMIQDELGNNLEKTRSSPMQSLAAREDGPLWYRGLAQESDAFAPTIDEILAQQRARAIVVGHTVSQDGRIRMRFGGKVFQIDTGMQPAYVPNGRASALEIQHGTFTAIYEDHRDVLLEASASASAPAAAQR